MNAVSFFSDFLARAREKMDPDKSVVFSYDGVSAHLGLPYASPPRHRWKGFKLSKATPMADTLSPEIERCACITGMREKP